MACLHLVLTLVCLFGLADVGLCQNRTVNMTLAMPNMTAHIDWLYEDCGSGILSDIKFLVDYAYANQTVCKYKSNPVVPVEWTEDVQTLFFYGQNALKKYEECIADRDCPTIHLSEWKTLAHEQYKACTYCEDKDCSSEPKPADNVSAVISTMFLYIEFKCTLHTNPLEQVAVVSLDSEKQVGSLTAKLDPSIFSCQPDQQIDVAHITEHAERIRVRVSSGNVKLVRRVTAHVDGLKASPSSDPLLHIPHEDFTVSGGYYWGSDATRALPPYCLLIFYECVSPMSATAQRVSSAGAAGVTNYKRSTLAVQTNSMNQKGSMGTDAPPVTVHTTVIFAATAVVLIILTATLTAFGLTIRNMKRHRQQQLSLSV